MSWIWYVCQGQQQKCAVGGTRGLELSTAYSSGSQVIYDWVPFCATIDFVTPVKPICVAGWLFFLSLSAKCCQLPSIFSHYCSFLTCVCVCPLYVSWTPCRRFRDLAGERHQRLFDFPLILFYGVVVFFSLPLLEGMGSLDLGRDQSMPLQGHIAQCPSHWADRYDWMSECYWWELMGYGEEGRWLWVSTVQFLDRMTLTGVIADNHDD